MEALINLVLVKGDILETVCRLFILGFSLEFLLTFAYIIKSALVSAGK